MSAGAQSPEELDTLLEDAFVLRDAVAMGVLFEVAGVLAVGGLPAAHVRAEIGRVGGMLWEEGHSYVADPRRVLTSRDVALVVGPGAVHVARRGRGGNWRYVISLLSAAGTGGGGERCGPALAAAPPLGPALTA